MAGYYESNCKACFNCSNEGQLHPVCGPDAAWLLTLRSTRIVLLPALQRINKSLPQGCYQQAILQTQNFGSPAPAVQRTQSLPDYVQNGISRKCTFINAGVLVLCWFQKSTNNDFALPAVFHQFRKTRIWYNNGLPLVMVELKSPSRRDRCFDALIASSRKLYAADPSMAPLQWGLRHGVPALKAEPSPSGEDRFMEWKQRTAALRTHSTRPLTPSLRTVWERPILDITELYNWRGLAENIQITRHRVILPNKAGASSKATVTDAQGIVISAFMRNSREIIVYSVHHYLQEALRNNNRWITDQEQLGWPALRPVCPLQGFLLRQTPPALKAEPTWKSCLHTVRQTVSSSQPCRSLRKAVSLFLSVGISSSWRMRRTAVNTD